jgi:predicted porin
MKLKLKPLQAAFAVMFAVPALMLSGTAMADADTDARIQALEQQIQKLSEQLGQIADAAKTQAQAQAPAKNETQMSASASKRENAFFEAIKNVEFYGNLDLSVDYSTKGLQSSYPNGTSPAGHVGWQPDISTNLSYVGVRGSHAIGDSTSLVYQLETQLDISATSGSSNSNSASDSTVKGALTSRNSYVGIATADWGAVKIGKTDAPYKTSTARMNPFSGMLGDYSVIMGNTGGDNRVEFGTRLDHSLWYESPNMNGWRVNALVSPGQNRGYENAIQASGESSCTGGNIPGSGGIAGGCSDGSYGNAYSANVSYESGPLYITSAYEFHSQVNRSSDAAVLDPNDIGNEYAYKVGIQYAFPTKTTVSAIYEVMRRNIPAYLQSQNERSRDGFWLAATQDLTEKDSLSVGWAHAGPTPGDPGQHNTAGFAPDASANMYTLAYKHKIDKQTTWYADYALTANSAQTHYDLGAGGRGVTTDCHDGSTDPAAPQCFAGGRLQGISIGLNYKF